MMYFCGCGVFLWLSTCFEVTNPEYFNEDGDTLVLKCGETAIGKSSGLHLTFSEVLEEGRCPDNIECYWEGVARIRINIKQKWSESSNVVLPIYGYVSIDNCERQVTVDTLGYLLKLMQLEPYPEYPKEPDYSAYRATIYIEQIKDSI